MTIGIAVAIDEPGWEPGPHATASTGHLELL